jgi:hypothetical protein
VTAKSAVTLPTSNGRAAKLVVRERIEHSVIALKRIDLVQPVSQRNDRANAISKPDPHGLAQPHLRTTVTEHCTLPPPAVYSAGRRKHRHTGLASRNTTGAHSRA